MAALLSNSVDLVDLAPPADMQTLKNNSDIAIHATPTIRMIFLALSMIDRPRCITAADGKPLDRNPLKDARVCRAISMMINRDALGERILLGQGVPAMQIVPEGIFGYTPQLKPTYDLAAARKLLAEAGYPNEFSITVHGSSDRFLMHGPILQALGQSLARGRPFS